MELINCAICEIDDSCFFYDKERDDQPVNYVICNRCGLVYQNPRMNQQEFIDYYKQDFRKEQLKGVELDKYINSRIEWGKSFVNIVISELFKNRFNKFKKRLFGNIHFSVLDIGCGIGGIMIPFIEKGFSCTGIDVPSYYTEVGRKELKVNIIDTSISEYKTNKKYDVIILNHSLEHLLDPVNELLNIRKLLKKNGILYIEIPDVERPYNWTSLKYFFMLGHVYYYSASTLEALMNKCGYERTYIDSNDTAFMRNTFKRKNNNIFSVQRQHSEKVLNEFNKRRKLKDE